MLFVQDFAQHRPWDFRLGLDKEGRGAWVSLVHNDFTNGIAVVIDDERSAR